MRCLAQSDIEMMGFFLFIKKSGFPYGNNVGNAMVKKYGVVNSETVFPQVGQGIVTVPLFIYRHICIFSYNFFHNISYVVS